MTPYWKKLAYVAVALYLVVFTIWVTRSQHLKLETFDHFSSRNISPHGLSLAIEYLRERKRRAGDRPVATLGRSVAQADLEHDAVVFRIAPRKPPLLLMREALRRKGDGDGGGDGGGDGDGDGGGGGGGGGGGEKKNDADADADEDETISDSDSDSEGLRPARLLSVPEEAWVRGGGRLVLAVHEAYGPVETSTVGAGEVRKVFPAWPGVREVLLPTKRVIGGSAVDSSHTLLSLDGQAVVSLLALGAGDVYLLSCPEVFQNRHLGQGHHIALLEILAGDGRPVYFDEHAHGLTDRLGSMELLRRWGLGPFMVLLALLGLVIYWRKKASLGPPEDDYRETRSEAVDFVDSLSQLYRRAFRRDQALARYHQNLLRATALKTRLRGEALRKRVDALTDSVSLPAVDRRKRDLREADFLETLGQLNQAYQRLDDDRHR